MIAKAKVVPWNELIVAILLLACFSGFLYCFYNLVLDFLSEFEATILNLSLFADLSTIGPDLGGWR